MKITFISGNISRSGGTERVLTLVANELSKRGYEISVLSIWGGARPYFELDSKIRVYTAFHSMIVKKLYKTWFVPRMVLNGIFKKTRPDMVICVDTVMFPLIYQSLLNVHTKIVAWEHFNYWHTMEDPQRLQSLRWARRYADKIVLLTRADYDAHRDLGKISSSKLAQIYNPAVFPDNNNPVERKQIVVAVGRLNEQKGFDRLIKIWRSIENDCKDWSLYIIGSGEDKSKLHNIADSLNLQNIVFVEKTKDISRYYRTASIYAMTSRYEGFPMVLLEASSAGLPIVSFDVQTGPAEIVTNGRNGYLVPDNDNALFASKLLDLIQDEHKREKFGLASLTGTKRFETKNIVDEWEALFAEMLGTKGQED